MKIRPPYGQQRNKHVMNKKKKKGIAIVCAVLAAVAAAGIIIGINLGRKKKTYHADPGIQDGILGDNFAEDIFD